MEEYKKDFEKSLCNNEYSEKLFISIAENIIKSYELTDYVKNVLLLPINSRDFVGYYDFKNIIIDYKKIECINLEYYYFDLFVTFFHELEHAKQKNYWINLNYIIIKLLVVINYLMKKQRNILKYIHFIFQKIQ